MPIYDFSGGFNALQRGLGAFSSGTQEAWKQGMYGDIATAVQAGDWDTAAAKSAAVGDVANAVAFKNLQLKQNPIPWSPTGDLPGPASAAKPPVPTTVAGPVPTPDTGPPGPQQLPTQTPMGDSRIASRLGPTAELQGVITPVSQKYGLDPAYLPVTSSLESSGGRNLSTPLSSASGPFAFTEGTARQYGVNPSDPASSAEGAARLALDNARQLKAALGREPTSAELYLAHQQGGPGAVALLTAPPGTRAADAVGAKAVQNNGYGLDISAQDFANAWINRYNQRAAALGYAPGATPAVAAPGVAPPAAVPAARQPAADFTGRTLAGAVPTADVGPAGPQQLPPVARPEDPAAALAADKDRGPTQFERDAMRNLIFARDQAQLLKSVQAPDSEQARADAAEQKALQQYQSARAQADRRLGVTTYPETPPPLSGPSSGYDRPVPTMPMPEVPFSGPSSGYARPVPTMPTPTPPPVYPPWATPPLPPQLVNPITTQNVGTAPGRTTGTSIGLGGEAYPPPDIPAAYGAPSGGPVAPPPLTGPASGYGRQPPVRIAPPQITTGETPAEPRWGYGYGGGPPSVPPAPTPPPFPSAANYNRPRITAGGEPVIAPLPPARPADFGVAPLPPVRPTDLATPPAEVARPPSAPAKPPPGQAPRGPGTPTDAGGMARKTPPTGVETNAPTPPVRPTPFGTYGNLTEGGAATTPGFGGGRGPAPGYAPPAQAAAPGGYGPLGALGALPRFFGGALQGVGQAMQPGGLAANPILRPGYMPTAATPPGAPAPPPAAQTAAPNVTPAPAPAPAAAAGVQARKFFDDNPHDAEDVEPQPDGGVKLVDASPAALKWGALNSPRYGLIQDPNDPSLYHPRAGAAAGAPAAAAGRPTPPALPPEVTDAYSAQLARLGEPGSAARINMLRNDLMRATVVEQTGSPYGKAWVARLTETLKNEEEIAKENRANVWNTLSPDQAAAKYPQLTVPKGSVVQESPLGAVKVITPGEGVKSYRPLTAAEHQQYGTKPGDPVQIEEGTNQFVDHRKGPLVEMHGANKAEDLMLGDIEKSAGAVRQGAVPALSLLNRMQEKLNAGIITGWGPWQEQAYQLARIGRALGFGDSRVANTEEYLSTMRGDVMRLARATFGGQGSRITNMDLLFSEKASGMSPDQRREAIQDTLTATRGRMMEQIDEHNQMLDRFVEAHPERAKDANFWRVDASKLPPPAMSNDPTSYPVMHNPDEFRNLRPGEYYMTPRTGNYLYRKGQKEPVGHIGPLPENAPPPPDAGQQPTVEGQQ